MVTRHNADRVAMWCLLCLLVALGLAVAGCSGGSGSEGAEEPSPEPSSTSDVDGGAGETTSDDTEAAIESPGSVGQGSATVQFGGATYEFTTEAGCVVNDSAVLVSIGAYGVEDHMSLTATDDVVLVRLSVDGEDWEQASPAPRPEVSGSTATWTGDLINLDGSSVSETSTITAMC